MVEKLLSHSKNPDVLLFGIGYDKTSSFGKGSDKGPEAIIDCFDTQLELYERNVKWSPAKHLKISSEILEGIRDLEPQMMVEKVSSEITNRKDKYKFIISLGGEHSITIGILDSLAKSSSKITILQIDAHLDLRDDDSDYSLKPSKFAHSCVMRRALDFGFRIVPVGIRAYADFELETAKNNDLRIFEWPCVENEKLIKEIVNSIKTQEVYISLDVDGIDPSFMPATGTPVQGGLSWKFAFDLIGEIFEKKVVIGADIVEVCPRKDDHLTEFGAAQLAYYMIALKFKGRKSDKETTH